MRIAWLVGKGIKKRKKRSDTFWSNELILTGLKALVDAGICVNCYRLARDKSEVTSKVLYESIHIPTTGAKLYSAAYKKFGGLYKAIAKAGINHRIVRTDTKFWTKKSIALAIKALHRADIPLCVVKIEKDRSPQTESIIYKSSKIKSSGYKLYRKSIKKFGTWDVALEFSDLNPHNIRSINWSWDKKTIVRCVRFLNENNISLNFKTIEDDKNNRISKKLSKFLDKDVRANKLFLSGKKRFGSWDKTLRAAGFNPKIVRRDKKFWTKEMMIGAIKSLDEQGVLLDCYRMQFDRTRKSTEIVSKFTGKKTTGAALYSAVTNKYGSWTKVVKAVRLNPDRVGKAPRFWTKHAIVKSIRKLHQAGVPLNSGKIIKDSSEATKELLNKVISVPISGAVLHSKAKKHFSSWDNALVKASLDPSLIRLRGLSVKESGQELNRILQVLDTAGKPLNSSTLIRDSKDIRSITYRHLGKVISGISTLSYGRKTFQGWEEALKSAGYNPDEIVLRSRYGWSLSTIAHQVERVDLGNGLFGRVALMGEAPKTPEQILEERESGSLLAEVVSTFSYDDQTLLEEIFDTILQIRGYDNQEQLIKIIVHRMSNRLSEEKVKLLFEQIRLHHLT